MKRTIALLLAISLWFGVHESAAQTAYPQITAIKPVAAQVGTTSEHEISFVGNYEGAYQVFVTGKGVTGEVVPGKGPIKVKFTVAADAMLGVRDVRVATPFGVSTLGPLVIAADPIVVEKDKNNTPEEAQPISVPATVCGRIEQNNDIDFFKLTVKAGQAISFHVRSARLRDKVNGEHGRNPNSNLIITLQNAAGEILTSNKNFFFADPFLHHKFAKDGEYLLGIRDVRYRGIDIWHYSIEINERPFVTNVYPLQGTPGRPAKAELFGYNLPAGPITTTVSIPSGIAEGPWSMALPLNGGKTNPVPVVVSSLPFVQEKAGENGLVASAQPIAIPSAVNGRIEKDSDIDCYVFEAKWKERFAFEVLARRYQFGLDSALDSTLRIIRADDGTQLTDNDDFRDSRIGPRNTYSDSFIESWVAPGNDKYCVEIRDLQFRGGPRFAYLLKVTRAEPHFLLDIDTDKTLIKPGTGAVIFVRAHRKHGFTGPIDLHIDGLPAGVTATCGRILDVGNKNRGGGTDGCILLTTKKGATIAAANVTITGTAVHKESGGKEKKFSVVARPRVALYMGGGGRGHYRAAMHTVCVCKPLDIIGVVTSPTEITLKPGESRKIEVTVTRAKDFEKDVSLDVIYQHLGSIYGDSLPKGVTIDAPASKLRLAGADTKGVIVLKAAADVTPARRQLVPIMAHVSINFVQKMSYCGQPLWVTVEVPEKKPDPKAKKK